MLYTKIFNSIIEDHLAWIDVCDEHEEQTDDFRPVRNEAKEELPNLVIDLGARIHLVKRLLPNSWRGLLLEQQRFWL